MRRTTIMIPEDLKTRAAKRANSEGLSLGGFIRESLERALTPAPEGTLDDPFLNDNAVYKGDTEADMSLNHDIYLYGERL
jgi:hypothetical protein